MVATDLTQTSSNRGSSPRNFRVPDEKWGQAATAVVHLVKQAEFEEQAVKDHVRQQLAGHKTPKAIHPTDTPLRALNGKADYVTAKKIAQGGEAAR